jgi:hypothetical protein
MKPTAQVIDGRRSMRTLVDALAELEEVGWLKDGDRATVRALWMQLPDGAVVATVAVIAPGEQPHRVMMPAAARFTAKNTVGERHERDVGELDGAVVDRDGNVELPDGSYVHAVELVPVRLHEELTETEEEVLVCVLDVLGFKKECYRPLYPEVAPHWHVLDYALVAKVGAERALPSLKTIEREVFRCMPHVSRQTLATVLARAGLRRPRSGKRARPRSSIATRSPSSVQLNHDLATLSTANDDSPSSST